jgi:MFS family permease
MERRTLFGGTATQTGQRKPAFYYGWLIVGAAFLLSLLSVGTQSSFGNFLKPMSAEFGWDRATAAMPAAVAMLMNGLFQPFVGQLIDRVGPRRVITWSLLLLAVSTAAIALTPDIWYLTGVYGVVFALAISGAGITPNTALIARWFVRQRGRAMGLVNAGGSVGQLLLIPASMALLLQTNWRFTYLMLGVMLLAIGVPVAAFVLRSEPSDLGLLPDGEVTTPTVSTATEPAVLASRPAPLEPPRWQGALLSLPLWLLIGGFFVCGFTVAIISTHFVPFATDRGIAPGTAATALGLLGGCNIVGSLLAGTVSDRLGRKNPLALIYLVRAVAFGFLLTADTPWELYLFAIFAGLAWFSTVPLTFALTAEMYGIRHMGTLVGIIFLSHQVGGALSIYLAGWLFDLSGSYTRIYLIGIVLLLAAGLASYAIREQRYSLKYVATAQT